jgi:hypothetical protein
MNDMKSCSSFQWTNCQQTRRAGICAARAAALATLLVATVATAAPEAPFALGLNTAAWDGEYTTYTGFDGVATINGYLQQAHIRLLRYPGGSWADEYDWSRNTDIYGCLNPGGGNPCPESDSIDFDTFSKDATAAGAATFVTVNYGSGSPALAAAWVAHAKSTPGAHVALWEVGNENYGCWEVNNWLAGFPAYIQNYKVNSSVCPDTQTMAGSYANNALPFLLAMKHADPEAKIGVPWAFEPAVAAGAGVVNSAAWNDTVLRQDGTYIDFVDAHWYPFSDVSGLSDTQILASIATIPAAMREIRSELEQYDPTASVMVGETNISNQATTLAFRPVAALFAAGTVLEWLSQGATSVDWWDMNNYGSPTGGDYGMFSSGAPAPANSPLPAYYGYLLASLVAPDGAAEPFDTSSSEVYGFRSDDRGRHSVLLINTNVSQSVTLPVREFRDRGTIMTWTYSAATASLSNPIVQSTATTQQLRSGLSLPAESIVVIAEASF